MGASGEQTRRALDKMSEEAQLVENIVLLYCRGGCTIDTLIEFLSVATGRMRKFSGC